MSDLAPERCFQARIELGEPKQYNSLLKDCVGWASFGGQIQELAFLREPTYASNELDLCHRTRVHLKKRNGTNRTYAAIFHGLDTLNDSIESTRASPSFGPERQRGVDHFPEVRSLVRLLGDAVGSFISVNMYGKLPEVNALPSHRDPHHVLVAQYQGRANWTLCPARRTGRQDAGLPVLPPGCSDATTDAGASLLLAHKDGEAIEGAQVDLARPELDCRSVVLEPGQVLYIPRHVAHSAQSLSGRLSIHFTFGIQGSRDVFLRPMRGLISQFKAGPEREALLATVNKNALTDHRYHAHVPEDPSSSKPVLDSLMAKVFRQYGHDHNCYDPRECDCWGCCEGRSERQEQQAWQERQSGNGFPGHPQTRDPCDKGICLFFTNEARLDVLKDTASFNVVARGRRQGDPTPAGCTIGARNSMQRCPLESFDRQKLLQQRGSDIDHDCDCWFWSCCDHDELNPDFGRCVTQCDLCACPLGTRHFGCNPWNEYEVRAAVVQSTL